MHKSSEFVKRIWTHPANRGQRLRQLAHGVRYQLESRRGSEFVTPLGDRSRILATRGHAASSLAVYANPPDLGEARAWKQLLAAGDLFVDVGANVGVYTILMAEHGCQVVAVEPNETAREMLQRNLMLNGYEAEIVDCVLADDVGVRKFTHGLDSTNRIVRDGESEVRALTLDLLLGDRSAAGVKIDVEGAEHLVLEGARQALSEHRIRALQLEWNDASEANFREPRDSTLRILREYGYSTFRPSADGLLREDPCPKLGTDVFALAAD
jgi:FkbM family methyltransferase